MIRCIALAVLVSKCSFLAMSEESNPLLLDEELSYNSTDIPSIVSNDEPELLSSYKELPFDILSHVVNARASKCCSFLRNSSDFTKHVRNITHINPKCVTEEMLQDFLGCELGENENWVDLAI